MQRFAFVLDGYVSGVVVLAIIGLVIALVVLGCREAIAISERWRIPRAAVSKS